MSSDWPGIIDVDALKASYVNDIDHLVDAAKTGHWTEVFKRLDAGGRPVANQWRVGGKSWFAPLHHAAWLGAPVDVVDQLIQRGAWKSLRNADGDRPFEIAQKRGHHHLRESLRVRETSEYEQRTFVAWNRHLTELTTERTRGLDPVRYRPVPTELIALEQLESLWFTYPGMYGGFGMSIHKDRLFVESWSRVVGGSGQAHVITERGCVLVDEGFV